MGIIGGPPIGGVGSMPGRGGPPTLQTMSIIQVIRSTVNPMPSKEKFQTNDRLDILKELHTFGGGCPPAWMLSLFASLLTFRTE